MADRRRRRRRLSNSESELSEDEIPDPQKPKDVMKLGSNLKTSEAVDGTTTEVGTKEDDDEEEDEEYEETDDDTETTCTEYDEDSVIIEDGWIETERQSGDGEEQPDKNQEADLDDDEDQKNPAYIPRKGAFYEHDTRDYEEQEKNEKIPKKKLWKDDGKWDHDRFRPELQGPKSREELVAVYGYDIRDSDHPPDAPRRSDKPRRGRGNKRLGDFMGPRVMRGGSRNLQYNKPEYDSPRPLDYEPKVNYTDNKEFPVLNRKTMMYEYPEQNSPKDSGPRHESYSDGNYRDHYDNYQGNNQDSYRGNNYNNRSERGYGRGGRGGQMDRGGRGGNRGGARGGNRGGYNNNSYSDLRSRNERNAERQDYNTPPKNDRYDRNYQGNNTSNYSNNSPNYVSNSGPRKDKFDGRKNDNFENDQWQYNQRQHQAGPPGPGNDRQWQNSHNNRNQPESDSKPPKRNNQEPSKPPAENILVIAPTSGGRKPELLPDIPPEIVPPVTSANPQAFQPPVTSTAGQGAERKSYTRDRERRGKPGFSNQPAGKPAPLPTQQQQQQSQPPPQQVPLQRQTEPVKPGGYHHHNLTAGTGRVGHGHMSGSAPITMTSSSSAKSHDSQHRAGGTNFQPGAPNMANQLINKADQNRPKRYSSQRQRGTPDQPYPENMSAESASSIPGPTGVSQTAPRITPLQGAPPRMSGPRVTTAQTTTISGPRPSRPSAPNTSPNARAPPFFPAGNRMYQGSVPSNVYHQPSGPQDQTPPHTVAKFSPQTPALVQQPVAYAIPPPAASAVSQTGPRAIYTPTVAMTTPQQPMMPQGSYMATPMVTYPAQPPAGPPPAAAFPIQPGQLTMQGFPPPAQTIQAPAPAPPPSALGGAPPPPQTESGVHIKGGTTYFNPVLQQPSPRKSGLTYFNPVLQQQSHTNRSAARRPKSAIPIVNPQDLESAVVEEGYEDQEYDESDELTEESGTETVQQLGSQLSGTAQEFVPRQLSSDAQEFVPSQLSGDAQEFVPGQLSGDAQEFVPGFPGGQLSGEAQEFIPGQLSGDAQEFVPRHLKQDHPDEGTNEGTVDEKCEIIAPETVEPVLSPSSSHDHHLDSSPSIQSESHSVESDTIVSSSKGNSSNSNQIPCSQDSEIMAQVQGATTTDCTIEKYQSSDSKDNPQQAPNKASEVYYSTVESELKQEPVKNNDLVAKVPAVVKSSETVPNSVECLSNSDSSGDKSVPPCPLSESLSLPSTTTTPAETATPSTEPTPAEPTPVESKPAEPTPAEPKPVKSKPAEPAPETPAVDPSTAESATASGETSSQPDQSEK